jgi:glycosidase
MSSLQTIIEQLEARRAKTDAPYFVPGLWIDGLSTAAVQVNPFAFFHRRLSEIASAPPQPLVQGSGGGEWSQRAVVYNLFPRVTTAFDHNNDGRIALGPNPDGWRETGTLLKCIALLPYIQGMGFNTVHLLPITSIGQDGKKGTLGSPYAIREPYRLDTNLDEPAAGLTADQLFSGFVEAAHWLGMRVVMEFVLRTAAKDSDWISEHPDWFYWIRADVPDRAARPRRTGLLRAFGSPIFPPQTLDLIKHKVNAGDFANLPPPPEDYRALYTDPPHPEQVQLEDGRYIGTLDDGTRVRVPGAFTDWPPDDNQPPWSDVTYLRMYTHAGFNYMAYNTLRMYDTSYARPELRNDPLWEALVGVIPHYQRAFGIDGVLIDMGHALPLSLKRRIISSARQINPDFAFWDENFSISHTSCEEGYNAVVGYWLLGVHQAENVRHRQPHGHHGFPIAFFTAPENHNTPRRLPAQWQAYPLRAGSICHAAGGTVHPERFELAKLSRSTPAWASAASSLPPTRRSGCHSSANGRSTGPARPTLSNRYSMRLGCAASTKTCSQITHRALLSSVTQTTRISWPIRAAGVSIGSVSSPTPTNIMSSAGGSSSNHIRCAFPDCGAPSITPSTWPRKSR